MKPQAFLITRHDDVCPDDVGHRQPRQARPDRCSEMFVQITRSHDYQYDVGT